MRAVGIWGRGGPVHPTPWRRLGWTGCRLSRCGHMGQGGPVHPTPWRRLGWTGCRLWAGWATAAACPGQQGGASWWGSLPRSPLSWSATWRPGQRAWWLTSPSLPLLLFLESLSISSVSDTDGNFGIKSLLLLLVALEPPHPHWQGQAKDSACGPLRETSAAWLS